jgi:TonB-linked SusC/RagA family outer membrane protein
MKLKLTPILLGLLTVCLFSIQTAYSQNKTVTGKVTDEKDGTPVAGASVTVKGTKLGTQTDANGSFSLSVPASATTLVISSISYSNKEVPIADGEIAVLLAASASNLNEIVVVGYGTARKKDLTGAVGSVKSKDFNKGLITAPDQLLQGKVAGIEITSNNGQPGAATTIKIRGNNSIRANNNPLYVVDGVPLDGRTARPPLNLGSNGLNFGTTPENNPLLYINPNDIAQIDVLKDASSAAIYGSRGANGVVLITTKKGGTGTKVDVGANWGYNAGFMSKYKVMTASEFRSETKKNNLNFDSSASVDALDAITQDDLSQNYNLAFSGGNDNGKFRASFLGSSTQGFIKKTSLDKYIGSFNGQYKFLDKKLSIEFNLIAGHTKENMALISNTAGAGGNLISYALNWNPTKAFRNNRGFWNLQSNSIPNPLAVIDGYNDVADVNVFLGSITGGYKILDNLEYKFMYAINHGAGSRETNIDGWIEGIQGVSGIGYGGFSTAKLTSETFTHTLQYNAELTKNLRMDAIVGYEYWKTNFSTSTIGASQFNTNLDQTNRISVLYTDLFQNAKTQFPLVKISDPDVELQSVFGRLNFNLSDKYYLTATLRADGSSKFGENNRYGYFPSVGARWIISNEGFMKGGTFIKDLSLRGSWGITGNQEFPAGASLEQFSSTAFNSFGQSNVANPDLKWEETSSINFGLDYSLLNGKLYGSIDWYSKNTTNLLFQSTAIQPAPASIFFINLPANLINTGIEFSIGSPIITGKNFNWDIGANFAYNTNKLTNFDQAPIETGQVSGQGVSGATAQRIANDQPVNVYYLKQFQGFDKTTGQQIITDDPAYVGDPNTQILLGFYTNLSYNKLSLSINGSGAMNYEIYNNTFNTVTNISNLQNGKNVAAANIGSGETLNASVAASSRYLEDGSFFKLRNATLNYAVGNVGKYIKNLNAFISGTNLFVITGFTGFDPEVNVDKSNNGYPSRNMEYIPYPTPRVLTFGVNLSL